MNYRKLRIAWSAFFGLLCALLVVLWVRSYFVESTVTIARQPGRPTSHFTKFRIADGVFRLRFEQHYTSATLSSLHAEEHGLPIWVATLGVVLISVAIWKQWRFSLRTLLIAITLVAVGLGLIVWAAS